MSVVFGICQAEGHAVEERKLIELARATDRYAPDGTFTRGYQRVGMGFQPYHTHLRSRLESQPAEDEHGNMLTLDGRIDNHDELCGLLDIREKNIADSRIVLAAFERWREECFARLVGDWALALWFQADRSLYLARDHAGCRTLCFERTGAAILWSTYLETFFAEKSQRELSADYAACYLACQPTRDLTPYKNILSVPPAHYAVFHGDTLTYKAHWQSMVRSKLRYKTDAEYQERFLALFGQSVLRRSGAGAPIFAELSGGMDSTSIVAMSDRLRKESGSGPSDLLDTVSYYDDSEANWSDSQYFTIVEAERGKTGIHLPVSFQNRTFLSIAALDAPRMYPGADSYTIIQEEFFENAIAGRGYRSILSGVGGDEVLGGVPSPYPELADLLTSGHLFRFLRQTIAWCLPNRRPAVQMVAGTVTFIGSLYRQPRSRVTPLTPWLPKVQVNARLNRLQDNRQSSRLSGLAPSQVANGRGWWSILETLPNRYPGGLSRLEFRYPYLDRDLVDFLFSIPREQLAQPGRRRSLMRRSLVNIVPAPVLERRRKASIIRGPLASIQRENRSIRALLDDSLSWEYGLVDPENVKAALDLAVNGSRPEYWPGLMRLAFFEIWLRHSHGRLVPPGQRVAATFTRSANTGAQRSECVKSASAALACPEIPKQ